MLVKLFQFIIVNFVQTTQQREVFMSIHQESSISQEYLLSLF